MNREKYPLRKLRVYGTVTVPDTGVHIANYITAKGRKLGMKLKTMRLNDRKRLVVRVA